MHVYNVTVYLEPFPLKSGGRDSSVGIATRCGLDVPVLRTRRTRDFPHLSGQTPRPTQPAVKWVLGVFPGRGVEHPPSSRAEVTERIELYRYSPSGSSWRVIR